MFKDVVKGDDLEYFCIYVVCFICYVLVDIECSGMVKCDFFGSVWF